ncbi:MAG TPA: S1 RNA-binding domain-containing protein [Thermoanaerobaculia bacterium]|nr:S1 RNA-binding domain-containing protein [Thermoanaerobaculia bacterium]
MSDSTDVIAPPEEPAAAATAEQGGGEEAAELASDSNVQAAGEAKTEPAPKADAPAKPDDAAKVDDATKAALSALRKARDTHANVEGRVFGWNPGGFHVVIDGLAAFVPRSEMELEPIAEPEAYLDKTFPFRVLKIQGKGRRIVLSRTAILREEQDKQAAAALSKLRANDVLKGKVASLTEFGAFVDIGGGIEGLVHVSEISRSRIAKPADALQVGQEVEVKVLKVEKGGKRVSLSMKALEPDPWREIKDKYPEGAVVTGTVERTDKPGAFIQLEPGLVGLLPTSEMGLPREAIPARAYPKGKEVKVQVVGVDAKRRRISLAPEGSQIEGTRGDYQAYLKQQRRETEAAGGFNALASALSKIKRDQPDR